MTVDSSAMQKESKVATVFFLTLAQYYPNKISLPFKSREGCDTDPWYSTDVINMYGTLGSIPCTIKQKNTKKHKGQTKEIEHR